MSNVIARTGRAAAVAAALLLSAGCATKHDVRDLRLELVALSARQDSLLSVLARQNVVTQDTLRSQTDRLFEIRGDVARQLRSIQEALDRLTELTGQNQRTMSAIRDQLDGLRRGGGAGGSGGGESVVGEAPPGGVQEVPNTAERTYAAALNMYQRDQLNTALQAFRDFVQAFPNHDSTPDARYFVGDILETQEKTQEALDAFNQIPQLNPTSSRVPDALYRAALIYLKQNKKTEARRNLDRVVNSYPDSNSAGPAREKLREIR